MKPWATEHFVGLGLPHYTRSGRQILSALPGLGRSVTDFQVQSLVDRPYSDHWPLVLNRKHRHGQQLSLVHGIFFSTPPGLCACRCICFIWIYSQVRADLLHGWASLLHALYRDNLYYHGKDPHITPTGGLSFADLSTTLS